MAACGLRLVKTSEVHFPLRRGEEDASNPLLGVLIDGKYRITNVLGKGGMGTVYRAVHEVSLVPVALKILHPRFGSRADYRDHFVAEARKAGRVGCSTGKAMAKRSNCTWQTAVVSSWGP